MILCIHFIYCLKISYMHIMIKSIPYFLPSNSSPSPNTHFPSQIHVLFALSPLNPPIPACTCMGIDSSSGSWAAKGLQPWRDLTLIPPSAISSQSLLSWFWNLMTTYPHACQDFTWLISCMQSQHCELMCAMAPPCPKNTVWLQSITTSGFYKCSTSSMMIFESWNGGYAYV